MATCSGSINDYILDDTCKKFNIDKTWIGDNQLHQIKNLGASDKTKTSFFTIELKTNNKEGFIFHGLTPDPETYDESIPREFWSFVCWEMSMAKGLVIHEFDCGGTCKCVRTPVLISCDDDFDDDSDNYNGFNDDSESILVPIQENIMSTPFDLVIEHPDFQKGCDAMGFNLAWIRDGKPHTWTVFSHVVNVEQDDEKDNEVDNEVERNLVNTIHDERTIDACIDKNENLYFFGKFKAKETDAHMYPEIQLGEEYAWEWNMVNGLFCY